MTEPRPTYRSLTGMSKLEASFLHYWRVVAGGEPEPEREYRFHPNRDWRCDFAWPDARVIVEVEGGTWVPGGGRHNRPGGYEDDCRKYNAAVHLGWRVYRCTGGMLENNPAGFVEMVKEAVCSPWETQVLRRLQEARYAMVAGNTDAEPIPPAAVDRWLDYIADGDAEPGSDEKRELALMAQLAEWYEREVMK